MLQVQLQQKEGKMEKVNLLDEADALKLTRRAVIVGIHWNTIPWTLILDIDAELWSGTEYVVCRAWMAFTGFSQISLPINNLRLPQGILTNYDMKYEPVANHSKAYQISCYAISEDDISESFEIRIIATGVITGVSKQSAEVSDPVSHFQRVQLATLDDFLEAFGSQPKKIEQN